MVVTQLEPPRFGGALLAVVSILLLGLAGTCFAVALSSQAAIRAGDPGILSVSEAAAAVEGGQSRERVLLERTVHTDANTQARSALWAAAER